MRIKRQPAKASAVRLAALCTLLAMCSVAVWAEPAGLRYPVNQPSQPLSDALKAIARQTNSSVLFDPGALGNRVSQPVAGQLSGAEAIWKALEGTGLTSEVMKDGSIVVKPKGVPAAAPTARSVGVSSAADSRAETLLAQAPAASSGDANRQTAVGVVATNESSDRAAAPQKIEVTGSRVKRVETDGALPVNVYTKADIDRSGQPNLDRFLSSLNEVSVSAGEGVFGLKGQATVQLRGLPVGTTLILVNGRRVESVGSSAGNAFNLNLIPLAAVERVEILPVGSSAVYGGDALAGVVNIILKKSGDGFAADVRYGSATGTEDVSLSLMTGGNFDRGQFLLLGAVSKRTPLHMGERAFFKDGDYRRFGGPDARSRSCTPGTVSSSTGANLPGLNSAFAGIPAISPGQAPTIADFAANAGAAGLCNPYANGNGFALLHGTETTALHAAADFRLGGSWSVFGELTYTDDRLSAEERGIDLTDVLVPASNAFNPFGEPVIVTGRLGLENGSEGFARRSKFARAFIGIRGEVAAGWDLEAAVGTAKDRTTTVDTTALTSALAASTPATALNPFTTGRAASEDVLRGIWSDSLRTGKGQRDQVIAFVRGPAFTLPAGTVDVVAGAEWVRDKWKTVGTAGGATTFEFDTGRDSNALYGEARVPVLFAASDSGGKFELITLTLAGRRDSYSDFGKANTYQAGLEVRPTRTALLRAATASSFKPPSLLQLAPGTTVFTTEDFGLVDPQRGNAPIVGGQVVIGPNAELQPETGKAQTLGLVWEPEALPGLRLAATAWQVKLRNQITQVLPQTFLDNESLFPGFVTRDASGQVTAVQLTYLNFGLITVSGTDMEATYVLPTALGKWSLSASATRTSKYDVVLTPGAPLDDRLGKLDSVGWAPKWKGRLGVGLDKGVWSLGASGRYLGSYKDVGTSSRGLGGTWTIDLAGSVDLKKLSPGFSGLVKSATLSAAIVNVGNKLPEFAGDTLPFYDVTQADWRGRYASVHLSVGW
jgi:iron complex outermembrane recepter protein